MGSRRTARLFGPRGPSLGWPRTGEFDSRLAAATCLGKRSYRSMAEVSRVVEETRRKVRERHGLRLNAFRCQFCGMYHVSGNG